MIDNDNKRVTHESDEGKGFYNDALDEMFNKH